LCGDQRENRAMQRRDTVWQGAELVRAFVHEIRAGVPYGADQIEIMLRVIRARATPVRRFIDLGCGSGGLARAVLGQYPDAEAILVDFSAPMLTEARAALQGIDATTQIVNADLADAGWKTTIEQSRPIDLIVSAYAIHHLTDERKRALYAEVFDCLTSGGLFLNIEHVASANASIEALSDELMIDTQFACQRRGGSNKSREQIAREFVQRPDKAANILAAVEDQCSWLRDIGFADVDCFFKVFELAVFGGRKP
jgi:trans-aconitate methyltransferase